MFSEEKIDNRLLKKFKKSKYEKDSLLLKLIQLTNNNFNEKEKLPTRVDYVEKQEIHPLHEKIFFVLQKFVKRAEKIIFSLVFICFRFTEISYFLRFPSNENVRKQHLSVNAYYCVNMKFSYTIAERKDEIFCRIVMKTSDFLLVFRSTLC